MHHGRKIAAIDARDGFAIEKWAAEIEIPMIEEAGVLLAGGTDSVGRQGMAAAVLTGIGAAVTGPENDRAWRPAVGKLTG